MKRFLLYAFTYILMTVSVAFGTVTIDSLIGSGSTTNSSVIVQTPAQETIGDKLLNNLLSMGGAEVEVSVKLFDATKQRTITANSQTEQEILPDIDISFNGNINISSLDDIKLNGTLYLKMQDTEVNLDIAFLNNTIYVSNETLNIKLETSSIGKVLELLPILGINLDIGLNLEEINVNDLMGALQNINEERIDENTLKLTLNLFDSFVLDILCDNEYNVTVIEAEKLELANYIIDISAGLQKNKEIEIESPEISTEKEFVDVTKTLNIVDSVKEIVTNEKLHLNLDAGLKDSASKISVSGTVDIDFSNEILVYADLNLNLDGAVHNLQLGYLNSNIYITFNGLKFMVTENTIAETINVISRHFNLVEAEENLLLEIAKILPGFELDDVLNGDFSKISIDNLLEFSVGEENVVYVTVFGSALNISSDIKVAIMLDENDQFESLALSGIKLLEKDLYANIEYSSEVVIPEVNNEDYLNFNNLPNLVDAIIETVNDITKTNVVKLNLNTVIYVDAFEISVIGDLVIDFSNENIFVYANLHLTALEKTINLELQVLDNVIYVSLDNLKLSYAVNDVTELIEVISNELNISTFSSDISALTSIFADGGVVAELLQGNLSAITSNLIKELNIVEGKCYIVLDKSLINTNEDIKLDINFDSQVSGIELTGLNFNSFVIALEVDFADSIVIPELNASEYTDLKYTKNLVSAILSTINGIEDTIALDVNINLTIKETVVNVNGTLAITGSDIYANLTAIIGDIVLPVELYLVENKIYLQIEELKVFTTIDNISQLVTLFGEDVINVTELVNEVFPKFDLEQILSGNLSTLSLDILKSLTINENDTTIVLSNEYVGSDTDISLKINYTNKLTGAEIAGINMFGLGLTISADMNYGFVVPTLNESSYNNLSYVYEAVNSILNTVNKIIENKEATLNLNANAVINGTKYLVNGLVYVNFANATTLTEDGEEVFDINGLVAYANIKLNLNGTSIDLALNLQNGYAFVEVFDFKVKVQIESVTELIEVIAEILPTENQLDVNELLTSLLGESVLLDVVSGDYSTISLGLIKSITTSTNGLNITLDKTLINSSRDVIINITYNNNLIDYIDIFNLNIKDIKVVVNAQLNYNYKPTTINEEEYFELSGVGSLIKSVLNTANNILDTKVIALELNNLIVYLQGQDIYVSGYVYVDFANAMVSNEEGVEEFNIEGLYLYADLNIKIFNKETMSFNDYEHNINVLFDGSTIYAKYNTLKISLAVNSINDVIDVITKLADLNKQEIEEEVENIDIVELLTEIFPGVDFEALLLGDLNALDLNVIKYLNIVDDSTTITLNKDVLGVASDISLNLAYNENVQALNLTGLSAFGFGIDLFASINYSAQKPTVNASEYSNLNSIADLMNAVYNTGVEVNENKNIAFGLGASIKTSSKKLHENDVITEATTTTITLDNSSFAKFDWGNAYEVEGDISSFNIEKLSIYAFLNARVVTSSVNYTNGVADESTRSENVSNHEIEITYLNNVVYLRYNNMKIKINGEGIGLTIDTICELIGIEVSTNSFENLLGLVTSIGSDTSILEKLKVEMIKSIALTSNKLSTTIDISPLELGFGEEFNVLNFEVIFNEENLEYLTIKDLSIIGIDIENLSISLTEFTPVEMVDDSGYMNFSSIGTLLESVKNTIEFTDFTIQGNLKLKLNVIGINLNWDIPLSIQLKLVDGLNDFEAKAVIGPVPVVGGVNDDAPYQFGNTISGINPGKDRVLTIYIKDNFVYFHRTEKVPVFASNDKVYEKKLKVHLETLLNDPLYYLLQYGLGFSDAIMNAIVSSMATERVNPLDYSNIVKGYTDNGNGLYTLSLNMVELTENPQLDTISVGIKVVEHNAKNVVGGLTFNMYMPLADGVEITLDSNNLTHTNIGQTIDFNTMYSYVNDYDYKEGAAWDAYNGDWQLSGERKFTLAFVTNSSETINPVEGVAGSRFVLPTPETWTVNDGITCTTYEFAGWYTTKTFDIGTEYVEDIMPRSNKTIYAKWNAVVSKYVTISFEENGGNELANIKILEGSNLTLPSYLDLLIVETENAIYTKQFDGWYIDAECTTAYTSNVAPTYDITLYALWTTVDMAETFELSIYDNGEKVATKYMFEGSTINLSGSAKFNKDTKYYTDSSCLNEYTSMIMPANNFVLHIRNKYSLTLISNYGTVVNSKIEYYQGDLVSIPSQSSYYYDDGTETSRTIYTFNGYYVDGVKVDNLSTYIMPNNNSKIEAKWTVEEKVYFTVKFNLSFKKPDQWNADSGIWGTMTELRAPSAVASVRVLEGSTFNPNPSIYNTTCRYKYKAVGISKEYEFGIKSWNTSEPKQLSYNTLATSPTTQSYTVLTSIVITDDTTLYPVWYYIG